MDEIDHDITGEHHRKIQLAKPKTSPSAAPSAQSK
jgi:hypothetical protein